MNLALSSSRHSSFNIKEWCNPSSDYSLCPFWFWNDTLDESKILAQIADFQAHGVDAFVIHPRIGLPRKTGWLSQGLFHYMRVALAEARKREMWVMLYDEGMYPSGSAGGCVVAHNPDFHVRGLICKTTAELVPEDNDLRFMATARRHTGELLSIYDQKVESVIRGLHYIGDENSSSLEEEEPPAADLLNPEAVQCFINLVYQRFYAELGTYFGNTVKAIFTDEPHPLSRPRNNEPRAGTTGILEHVNRYLGYDFTPFLPALWFDDEPDAARYRRDYEEAIAARLNETYYAPISQWCESHGIMLAGHPAKPDDIGHLRYFQIPGQDIVWRDIEPGKSTALQGPPSTMAKAAASSAFHHGKRRNLNEFAGAFGQSLTFDELQWLASWLLIRGCNLLIPHAFFYSMRGPRRLERPPDVGPNNTWWDAFPSWARMARRLCWLNTVGLPVCKVAILGRTTTLPWASAKACYESQIDFHYIEPGDLKMATVSDGYLCVGRGRYAAVVVEEGFEHPLPQDTPVLDWVSEGLDVLLKKVSPVVNLDPHAPALRARHLVTPEKAHLFLFFNESPTPITTQVELPLLGSTWLLDPFSGSSTPWANSSTLDLPPHGWKILLVGDQDLLVGSNCYA